MASASANSKSAVEKEVAAPPPMSASGRASEPLGEGAHHRDGEERRLVHEEQEALLRNRSDLASRLGPRSGRPGRSVDQGHLPENTARGERLHDFAVPLDFDLAGADDIHFVALVALGENDVARGEPRGREPRIGKKLEVDSSDRHALNPIVPPVAGKTWW